MDMKTNNLRKMGGGVAALLASLFAISDSASAINLTITNTTGAANTNGSFIGQSFKNDPADPGASIVFNLNDWTFAFANVAEANNALSRTLSIYAGVGSGNGTPLYQSTSTAPTTLAGFNSVKWTFTGATLTDPSATYTALIEGATILKGDSSGSYPNGSLVFGSFATSFDSVFQANFSSATPVPFEFEPTGGLLILGGGWLLRRHLKKKSTKV
jgi:hypothetical protein